jgi:hypothetical protein
VNISRACEVEGSLELKRGIELLEGLLNISVPNKEGVEVVEVVKFTGPAEFVPNRSNGMSILGVAFLWASFSGDVASDD